MSLSPDPIVRLSDAPREIERIDHARRAVSARDVQSEARSGEVVLEKKRLAEELTELHALPPGTQAMNYEATLKGLDVALPVVRLLVRSSPKEYS